MLAKELQARFAEYLRSSQAPTIETHDTVALLFGADEVRWDFARQVATFPRFGVLSCALIDLNGNADAEGPPEWFAVFAGDNGLARVLAGRGDPFSTEAAEILPNKHGRVMAMPSTTIPAAVGNRAQRRAQRSN